MRQIARNKTDKSAHVHTCPICMLCIIHTKDYWFIHTNLFPAASDGRTKHFGLLGLWRRHSATVQTLHVVTRRTGQFTSTLLHVHTLVGRCTEWCSYHPQLPQATPAEWQMDGQVGEVCCADAMRSNWRSCWQSSCRWTEAPWLAAHQHAWSRHADSPSSELTNVQICMCNVHWYERYHLPCIELYQKTGQAVLTIPFIILQEQVTQLQLLFPIWIWDVKHQPFPV